MSIQEQVSGPELRRRLEVAGILHSDMAARLGVRTDAFSRILKGRLPMPEGFADRFDVALVEITRERGKAVAALVGREV